jgi:hypothetical protein
MVIITQHLAELKNTISDSVKENLSISAFGSIKNNT